MKAGAAKQMHGFTLVELMIAMLLSLFLLGAITYVVVNSNKNYNTTDSLARLQENARFAMEFITRDLRRAGNTGCSKDVIVNNVLKGGVYGSGTLGLNKLEGVENMVAGSSTWLPSNTAASFSSDAPPVDGSDAIAGRYVDPNLSAHLVKEMPNESGALFANPDHGISKNDIIIITNCVNADLLQVTETNAAGASKSGKDELVHNTGQGDPGNETKVLSAAYKEDAQILKFSSFAYYVGTNANKRRALFRVTSTGTQELVEGVEHMEILYGLASGSGGAERAPTEYVKAIDVGNTADWGNVVSVRVGLLLGTIANTADGQYGVEKDTGTYTLNGTVIDPPDDRRLRKMFVSTVMLRNIK